MLTYEMADLLMCNRLEELSKQIDKLHLSYLHTGESLEKIDQRSKLEGCIKEFLCLVPHSQKFSFTETADVLHTSATTKDDFSGYKAASAWNAIGAYAANLMSQPWRKEYRELKMYCGFYKHEIDSNLVGAERMLMAMGYKPTSQTTMLLEGPIDPDKVSCVSRDSLIAFVECQFQCPDACHRYLPPEPRPHTSPRVLVHAENQPEVRPGRTSRGNKQAGTAADPVASRREYRS